MNIKIERVIFLEDYQLDILLSNSHRIIYNLEPKLKTARFSDLSDPEIFSSGDLNDNKVICWNVPAELSLEEILFSVTQTK